VNRRRFLFRGAGLGLGLAAGGLVLRGLGQEEGGRDGGRARGMITPAAQEAIDRGLAYLAREERPNGSFGTGLHTGSVAITSLAGLAFMAGGHQPGRGRYGRHVTRALRYILDQEEPRFQGLNTPGFLHNRAGFMNGPMYGHGFGTLFLAECYGMVHERDLRQRLRGVLGRAVRLIIDTQNAEGGWRYRPVPNDADISVTICQIMALRAARNAGFSVPRAVADRCTRYVMDCQNVHGDGGFRYTRQGGPTGFARTAAGVVALYSAGVYKGEAVEKGLEYLMRRRPGGGAAPAPGPFQLWDDVNQHYYYGHYYAAQAMWTAGGRYWRAWFPAIRDELLRRPDYNRAEGSWNDGRICAHYCTAMALIILQIPNNYLPILQR
jgi:hypothetical protein